MANTGAAFGACVHRFHYCSGSVSSGNMTHWRCDAEGVSSLFLNATADDAAENKTKKQTSGVLSEAVEGTEAQKTGTVTLMPFLRVKGR